METTPCDACAQNLFDASDAGGFPPSRQSARNAL
jgi:hypothetical protein